MDGFKALLLPSRPQQSAQEYRTGSCQILISKKEEFWFPLRMTTLKDVSGNKNTDHITTLTSIRYSFRLSWPSAQTKPGFHLQKKFNINGYGKAGLAFY